MPLSNYAREVGLGEGQFDATRDPRLRSGRNDRQDVQSRDSHSQADDTETHLPPTGTTFSWGSGDSIPALSTLSPIVVQDQPLLQTLHPSPRTSEGGRCSLQFDDVTENKLANELIANTESQSRTVSLSYLSSQTEKNLSYFRQWWFWEVTSLSLCVLSIIAVVILAAKLDGTLLSNWTVAVAPNTVISVLITIAKTSMLVPIAEGISQLKWSSFWLREAPLHELAAFDEASRGPWGSLLLFWPNNGHFKRRPFLSLVAAFITIASLALEPFAQQIVAFKSERMERPGMEALIPVTQMYESRIWQDGAAYILGGAGSREMEGAFFNGLYSSSIPIEFTCASGNCSWPEFFSFGLCDSCGDVSKDSQVTLEYYSTNTKIYDIPLISEPGQIHLLKNSYHSISVLTPSGFQLNELQPTSAISTLSDNQSYFRGPVSIRSASDLHDYVNLAIGRSGTSDVWSEWPTSIEHQIWRTNSTPAVLAITDSAFANLTYNQNYTGLNMTFPDASIANLTVVECAINWCAKKFQNVTVENGHVVDYAIENIPLYRSSKSSTRAPDKYWEEFSPGRNITHFDNTSLMYPFHEGVFFLREADDILLSQWLITVLNTISGDEKPLQGFGIGSALAYGTDITEIINNVATSITNAIRTCPASTYVKGAVWAQETFIYIQWVWLSLPIILVLLSIAVLAAIAYSAHRSNVPLWKSSILPIVFHGIEAWDTEVVQDMRMGLLEERRTMEQRAQWLNVSLSRSEFGESRFRRDLDISQHDVKGAAGDY
ncbi:hypothetical protein GGR51DRAFT_527087 [Nemania sp. FL0031]|nr:hypothetical protein GGR51DRAFT_527087 [Nemania sp. FL0031]